MNHNKDSSNLDSCDVPCYIEGPHIKRQSVNSIEVFYVNHESYKNQTGKITRTFNFSGDVALFNGFAGNDNNEYCISQTIYPDHSCFSPSSKIAAFGDIHGEYDSLVKLLTYNGIVDDHLNWTWGSGHLVFTGDIFDRGDQVTECLWLIFLLESQACDAGGHVHYLLGNHEIMTLLYDDRYVHPKYLHMCHFLKVHYSTLFDKESILGNWLRNKNSIIKIGSYLFVHGGISPQLMRYELSIDNINRSVRYHLDHYPELSEYPDADIFIYSKSPSWYRGYVVETTFLGDSLKDLIDETLKFYEASTIVFGHTQVSRIFPMLDYKLIAIDIPVGDPAYDDQGLLIYNQKFFRIFTNREKELL